TVVGQIGHIIEIDDDQVRLVARPDGAQAMPKTGGACVADGGMAENFVRQPRARLRLADRGKKAEHLHRLEHAPHARPPALLLAWNTLCTSGPLQLSQPSPSRTPDCRIS